MAKYIEDCLQVCADWGLIPTEFRQCMTWEEQVLWLTKFLKTQVLPAFNENTKEFQDLKTYVENYFDNLDISEEVDAKLDEMAESGELTDIIAQYLQLAGVLAYDNIAAMAAAENIANGSVARTLGKDSLGDGKGCFYKVREIRNTDVVDGFNLVALDNPNLVAEKVAEYGTADPTDPIYYGADPTGTVDSADAINACIQANLGKSICFTPGVYKVNSSILTPYRVSEQVNINFNGSKLVTDAALDRVIGYGYYNVDAEHMPNGDDYHSNTCYAILENFVIDAPNATVGVETIQNYWYPRLLNFSIFNTIIGIKLGQDNTPRWSSDAAIDNGLIQCKSYLNRNTRGIIINGFDNKIVNCRVYNAFIGIEDNKGGNFFINNHIYLYGHLNDRSTPEFAEVYPDTIAFKLTGSQDRFESVYFDSYNTAFKCIGTNFSGSFLQCFHNNDCPGYDDVSFDFSEATIMMLTIIEGNFDANQPSADGRNYGIKLNTASQRMDVLSKNLIIENVETHWIEKDLLNMDTTVTSINPFPGNRSFTANTYYKIAYIPVSGGENYVVGLTGTSNPLKQMCRFWVDGSYNIQMNNIGTAGTDVYMGAKIIDVSGMKLLEVSFAPVTNAGATFGVWLGRDFGRNSVGIIPVVERTIDNADPADFITTPDSTLGFEY